MKRKPTEVVTPDEKPHDVVERLIKESVLEPLYEAAGKDFQSFKNKWNDGEIDIPGLNKRMAPEEAAIAITGRVQQERNEWKAAALQLHKDNILLKKRLARLEKELGVENVT